LGFGDWLLKEANTAFSTAGGDLNKNKEHLLTTFPEYQCGFFVPFIVGIALKHPQQHKQSGVFPGGYTGLFLIITPTVYKSERIFTEPNTGCSAGWGSSPAHYTIVLLGFF